MEIVYCEIVGNDFFLDIVSWIVAVLSSTKIIYSSSFGEMVRMGTGSGQIVPDFISRKTFKKNNTWHHSRKRAFSYVLLFAGLTINFLFQMCTIGGDTFQVCY